MMDDGVEAFVAPGGAVRPKAEAAEVEVNVIADDEQVVNRASGLLEERRDTASGKVHVGVGADEENGFLADLSFGLGAVESAALEAEVALAREGGNNHEAEVVSRSAVAEAGVAEADDDLHG